MKKHNKAYFFALTAILFWSTIGSALKITLRYISFAELLFYATATSLVLMLAFLVKSKQFRELKQLKAKDLQRSALLGLLNPFLYYLILLKAYELLPAQEAGTLNYFWPVVLVLLSIPLLKQKIGWLSFAAILVSFAGTIIIATHGDLLGLKFNSPLGVGLALGSALLWSLFWIYNVKDKKDEIIKLFLNFTFGFIYIFIYLLATGGFSSIHVYGVLGSIYTGIFEMGITYILWLKAMKYATTTAKISNLVFISPFISLIFIHFTVGENILPSTIIGLIFIVGGILMQRFIPSPKLKE